MSIHSYASTSQYQVASHTYDLMKVWEKNPITGAKEWVHWGEIDLTSRNPEYSTEE